MLDTMRIYFKRQIIKLRNIEKRIKLGRNSNISFRSIFEGNNRIGDNSVFDGEIGYGSYIGNNCHISSTIGKFCSISDNVNFVSGTHPIKNNIATSPVFYSVGNQVPITFATKQEFIENNVKSSIADNVWIGFGVTVINGVHIGEGAVIGAGSLVNRDVIPYSVVAGVPAKVVRMRFSEDYIKAIIESKIWMKDNSWLRKNRNILLNVDQFIIHNQEKKDEYNLHSSYE